MSLNHFPWHLLHWHWNTMYKQGYSPRPQSNNKGLYYVKLSFSSCVVRPTKWGGEAHLFLSVPFSVTFSVSELAVLIYRPLWCQNGLTPPPTPPQLANGFILLNSEWTAQSAIISLLDPCLLTQRCISYEQTEQNVCSVFAPAAQKSLCTPVSGGNEDPVDYLYLQCP